MPRLLLALGLWLAGCHAALPFSPSQTPADAGASSESNVPVADGLSDTSSDTPHPVDTHLPADMGPPCSDSAPLQLHPLDATSLAPAIPQLNSTCKTAYGLDSIEAYEVTGCSPSIDVLTEQVLLDLQLIPRAPGSPLDRAQLLGSSPFGACSGSAALFAALDAFAMATTFEAWSVTEEIRCQNCTEFMVVVVVHYPETHRVLVLTAHYGWDS